MITARLGTLSVLKLLAALACFAAPQAASAEHSEIKAVVAALHAAIEARNVTQLAAVWQQGPDVDLVNPRDTSVAVGWDLVKGRWEQLFDNVTGLEIAQVDGPHTNILGDVAWSVGISRVVTHFKTEETKQIDLVENDVLVRQGQRWVIVSHTARPIQR